MKSEGLLRISIYTSELFLLNNLFATLHKFIYNTYIFFLEIYTNLKEAYINCLNKIKNNFLEFKINLNNAIKNWYLNSIRRLLERRSGPERRVCRTSLAQI